MKNLFLITTAALALVLAGCGKSEPAQPAIESVESLVANPERLKDLRAQCKADHARMGDAQCHAVAEATRQRFMSGGQSPYANDPVPPPAAPASPPADAGAKD
ncbi:EexN family lipoprotein [Variovorax sp. S2]|uniref:EexN family lipoprotein n=1 Tax=Variovorax sp. S12S4 TaxID=3029170 RepID=UPI00215CF5BF|nr:EexN family lipoprotein [Variovorax sp. S12S4]MCR8959847.1 EexN family lipoprotein [Variovorax sp. S12S4]